MKFSADFQKIIESSDFIHRLKVEKKIIMDNTEFTNWNPCIVKGMYFGGARKISANGATPLLYGQAVHTGLKHLLLEAPLEEATQYALADAEKSNLDSYLDPKRNKATLIEVLAAYDTHVKIVPTEKLVPIEVDGVKLVEQSFCVPLGFINFKPGELFTEETQVEIYWSGVIDVMNYLGPALWITDHKTTSVMGPKFVDTYLRSSQMLGYTHVARILAEKLGKKVEGVMINALASRSSGFEFQHHKIPMADWKIEEWHSETLLAIKNIILQTADFLITGELVPNREQCVSKYGRCQYFDLCENLPIIRDRLLQDSSFYIDNTWDPNAA